MCVGCHYPFLTVNYCHDADLHKTPFLSMKKRPFSVTFLHRSADSVIPKKICVASIPHRNLWTCYIHRLISFYYYLQKMSTKKPPQWAVLKSYFLSLTPYTLHLTPFTPLNLLHLHFSKSLSVSINFFVSNLTLKLYHSYFSAPTLLFYSSCNRYTF